MYLVNRQEDFKRYPLIWLQMVGALLDIRLSRILPQSSECISNLRHMDFAIAARVEKLKGLLKFFSTTKTWLKLNHNLNL